jgi:hypothetical protein
MVYATYCSGEKIRAEVAWVNEAAAPNFNYLPAVHVTFVAAPWAH